MILHYGIDSYLKEADNIYDLIGNCFGLLCESISNHQLYISRYLDNVNGSKNNPNLKCLNVFSEKIMAIIKEYKPSIYPDILCEILKCIDETQLKKYRDDKENQLTVIYSILSSIDAAAMTWERKWMTSALGPLDRHGKTSYRVYFKTNESIHSTYTKGLGRDRTSPSTFFEQFESFRFIDSSKWKPCTSVPQIKYLPKIHQPQQFYADDLKLKIAVIPVSCNMNFQFVPTAGSGVRVDYSKNDQTQIVKVILLALKKAINAGCNIIILPEYVVSPDVHRKIQNMLKYLMQKSFGDNKLLAVFEGSTWTDDDNNVMRILDSWGNELGKYYKYSPFTKNKDEGHGFEKHEALTNPGLCCDMIAIENIGLFLPAICRDVIDGEYTEEIIKMLFPAFIIISAWSPSVASFEIREKEFANKYFSSSVFANACSSVNANSEKIGNGCIVSKEGTIAGANICDICRCSCLSSCGNDGCVYMLEYNFKFDAEHNTSISVHKICQQH